MLEASIQQILKRDADAKFYVFSVYPVEDTKFNNYGDRVIIMNARPFVLGLLINPLALMYRLMPPLRFIISRQQYIEALLESSVLLDEGGITFVDKREKFLIYNIATILPAILLRVPVVKCSQAMGPFSGINKLLAKLVLPRVSMIYARGDKTEEHLKKLGLKNISSADDLAFMLAVEPKCRDTTDIILSVEDLKLDQLSSYVCVMPSEVLRKKASSQGQDYVQFNVDLVNGILERGHKVLLIAYSARGNTTSLHNNDLPLCREIANRIDNEDFKFLDAEFSAQQLRLIIEKVSLVVTSRFHAMIAALSVEVPPLVIGWSHKYEEVMTKFEIQHLVLRSEELDYVSTLSLMEDISINSLELKRKIKKKLPIVKRSSSKQIEFLYKQVV